MKTGANNITSNKIEELRKKIDFSDIPEIKDFSEGHLRNWIPVKKPISFRIDIDNLEWLKSEGDKGYQKRLNGVLRWARLHGCPLAMMI